MRSRIDFAVLLACFFAAPAWAGPYLAVRPSEVPVRGALHFMDGVTIGVVEEGRARAGDVPYDDPERFVIIAHRDYVRLQNGELPAAWRVALGRSIDPDLLRAIPALAQDGAQVLIRLPEELAPVASLPGGRCQRLAPTAPRGPRGLPPTVPREHGPEFWQALSDATNSARLFADLEYLSTELRTRFATTPEMALACDYAYACFDSLGLDAWYDPFNYHSSVLTNVVGAKLGIVYPDQIYIICGHLDSISPQPETEAPGAEDNGSGAAAVLEAARLLSPLDFDCTLYFICFSAEELGLVGSEHFASQAAQQGLDIRGVLNLDMVGYYEEGGADLWLEGFHTGTSSVWLMELVGENTELYTDLEIYLYPGDGWGSDHVPFHEQGYPAILSIENEWASYPCYHATCDEIEWLDADLWRGITAANVVSLAQLAQIDAALGMLEGTVSAVGGGCLPDVTLTLTGTGYAARVSDPAGEFSWAGLFPGRYTVTAEKYGYLPATTAAIVPSGGIVSIEIEMEPSSAGLPEEPIGGAAHLAIHPTPVVAATTICLTLPSEQGGRLAVYDPAGRRVALLADRTLAAGEHRVPWAGDGLPAGIYHVRWDTPTVHETQTVTLLR